MFSGLIIAARGLRRSPAFTLAAVVTLALGIGANSTMFSVVNSVLLRPLPGYETDRLVQVADGGKRAYLAPEIYLQLHETLQSFETLAANQNCRLNLTGQGEAEQLAGPCVTANWFEMLHAPAKLGRTFLPDEDQHGRDHVAVLDYGFWQRRFAGDERILNSKMILDNEPWTVIGIMPPGFKPSGFEVAPIYTPYVISDHPHGLNVIGRLKPGVSIETAQAELDLATARLSKEHPALRLKAAPLLEQVTGAQRPLLLLLLGAVSLVLLIACVNVANLMLARSAARQNEIAIRLALGATRWRILRFVLAEALVVSAAASACALIIAHASLKALRPLTATLPRAEELSIDWRVLATTMALGLATALVFGILPAVRSSRLKGAAGLGSRTTSTPQRLLIVSEVALAFILLAGAGLLIQTFAAIRSHDLGYDPRHVLTNFLALPESPDGTRTAGAALYARIRERVVALPGVRNVATASCLPMFGVTISMDVHPDGEPVRKQERTAALAVISDDYFRVMSIPLLTGRMFAPTDRDGSTRVAIISKSVARHYFGDQPIGRRLILPEFKYNIDGGKDVTPEIVGVAGNVCQHSVEDCDAEHIYLPETQNALRMENLLVRTEGDPKAIIPAVRRAMYLEAPNIPLGDPQTLEERTDYLSRDPGRAMWTLGVFAALAIVLAAAGIFGVSSYLATQRSKEIGIRMALGANPGNIAGLVYRGILMPSALGLTIGIAGAAAVTRLLKSLLFGVAPGDPKTLAIAGVVLLSVSVLAATTPAIRAALTDPAEVLRRE
jgi:putative ABC transport system permease protein